MFKHLFSTMNEVLDRILDQYPSATGESKSQLEEELSVLKAMSDTCIEEWLQFEEKLGQLYGSPVPPSVTAAEQAQSEPWSEEDLPHITAKKLVNEPDQVRMHQGQGYYKLHMFDRAAEHFEWVVDRHPEHSLARVYLAMSYLRLGNYSDAYRHFRLLLPLADDAKIKAISLNGMGCIQAEQDNLEKACEYFQEALYTDPSCVDPILKQVSWPRMP